ncbi:hypothetical protein SAY86_007412 [Trapa natans]|uniref:Delta(14)-sterol reductase n=1 Tax=Trapa natans TaxID=22666 RepID=A0AAN7LHB2_TRANT|nr:hypothetical protein SAY86_007412 [Trapa natans]
MECKRWESKGINVKYEIRDNRKGYKAGALREGMKRSYVKHCDYVAIFDADFQPESDFLCRTIPFLLHNPQVSLVQARWKFVNSDECLMTRMQEMSLDYHFTVEQEVGSSTCAFFGFNGTAGVWRISALNEAGGWKDRTTVEDMDLAVRASLKGWKFVYISSVKVKNELPSTFKAYRYQQHRWSCGPANLFRKMVMEIIRNKKVSLWKKVHVIYSFFIVRKIVAHIVTFTFYCIVLPATVLVPEVTVPKWGSVYIPSIITILNAVGTPRSLHLLIFWILFENVMSLHRSKAAFIGLLEAGRVNEWIVTEKLGDALKAGKAANKAHKKPRRGFRERLHLLELGVGAYLFICGCYDLAFGKNHYFFYLYAQSIAFFITGFGYVALLGTFFAYLAVLGSVLPGKVVPGAVLQDGTRLHYRCNGLLSLLLLVGILGLVSWMNFIDPTIIAERGLELLSATFIFSILVALVLYAVGIRTRSQSSSLKPHVSGNYVHDWWFGIQLNPQFMGIDLKFFFVRAGMMGWLLLNLSVLARSILGTDFNRSMILYQLFCTLYIMDYFIYEEYMTSTWDIIAERLGFMLVFGDLVWIPFTFSIQGWWLLKNKVELTTAAVVANCLVFLLGYVVFRGANKQKHMFKRNPKAPIWGQPPKVIGGKLLASGYWGIARHCNYLGDLLLALSFSLPCGISSPVPYFYPIYLLILLIWRERRDEARCAEKYREVWSEYRKLVPWRILPYIY